MFTAQLLKTPQSSQESSAKGRFEETFPQADTIAEMHCMRCPEPAATTPAAGPMCKSVSRHTWAKKSSTPYMVPSSPLPRFGRASRLAVERYSLTEPAISVTRREGLVDRSALGVGECELAAVEVEVLSSVVVDV